MVKDTKNKLSHLKENRLTKYMIPILWKSFHRADVATIISKWNLCESLLFAHMLEVGTPTFKAHLNALQEASHPLRSSRCLLALNAHAARH